MPPTENTVQLNLQIQAGADSDATELDRLTRQLLTEIREMGVESAELVKSGETPAGTKGADPVTLGALAVAVLPGVATKIIEFLQTWSMRGENRTVKIKALVGDKSIEVEYSPATMSNAQLKRTVDTLIQALPQTSKTNRK